jgi:ABC-type transport system substrate-binding protein
MKAVFPRVSLPPNTKDVGNANDYYVLHNLIRPLISYGEHAQFVGDALARWEFDPSFKIYDFTLRDGIKFSNGEVVTSDDAVATIRRMMRFGKVIHYDFTNIDSVVTTGTHSFRLILKKADRNILEAMTAPEFGPLHKSDLEAKEPKFKVTSGAYFVDKIEDKKLFLKRNKFHGEIGSEPQQISILSASDKEEMTSGEGLTQFDFFPEYRFLNQSDRTRLTTKYGFHSKRMNLGFTDFAGLNANQPLFKDLEMRVWIQSLLKVQPSDVEQFTPIFQAADQLYLPDGPGRVKKEELQKIWKRVAEQKKPVSFKPGNELSLLVRDTPPLVELTADKLKAAGFKVNTTIFKTWGEYSQIINGPKKYDVIVANNDFSAIEVLENLRVTFNPGRPLIVLPKDSKIPALLEKAAAAEMPEERYAVFESIEKTLLEDALIVPLFNSFMYLYYKPSLNMDAWNKTVPEIPLWKIKVQ